MTRTIPNVPRELLADLLGNDHDKRIMAERHLLAMLANAPSPAGVDDDYAPEGLVQAIMQSEEVDAVSLAAKSLKAAGVDGWDVAGDILEKLSAAQAIIDGLRGENERIRLNIAEYNEAISCYQSERDQQAQRIGELEGLLRHAQKQVPTGSGLHMRIDAALSAVCAAAPNIAPTSEHNGS